MMSDREYQEAEEIRMQLAAKRKELRQVLDRYSKPYQKTDKTA